MTILHDTSYYDYSVIYYLIYFLQAEVFQELEKENLNCCQPENVKI